MWHFFQGLIIFAVVASNIHWQWTPNGYLASVIGVAFAWLFTQICNEIAAQRARQKRR